MYDKDGECDIDNVVGLVEDIDHEEADGDILSAANISLNDVVGELVCDTVILEISDCNKTDLLGVMDGDTVADLESKAEEGLTEVRTLIDSMAHMNAKSLPGVGHFTTAQPSLLILSFRFFK